jgi:hypothetical protein
VPDEHWRRYPPEDLRGWLTELRQRTHELATEVGKLQTRVRQMQDTIAKLDPTLAGRFDALEQRHTQLGKGALDVVAVVSHTLIVVALVAAAVVLQVTGNDAALAWGALGGYLGGAGIQKATGKTS